MHAVCVSDPFVSVHIPVIHVLVLLCFQLCLDQEIDWKNVNLKKMRVKQLKKILSDWDETCKGCVEKSDYIKKIEEVKKQHTEL